MIFAYVVVGICLFTFSSCEEDSEIFDNVEFKKETENDGAKKAELEDD